MESFRLDKAGILLWKETSKGYRSEKLLGFRAKDLSLTRSNFLVRHLKKTGSPEIQEELTLKIKDASSREKAARLAKMKEEMRKIETEVCLPVLSKGQLGGFSFSAKKFLADLILGRT